MAHLSIIQSKNFAVNSRFVCWCSNMTTPYSWLL